MKHLLFVIIILSLSACNRFGDQKPVDLIPQKNMVDILVDIHVADAVVEHKFGPTTTNIAMTNALYNRIYQNYGITAAQYKTSYKYYEAHPDIMDKMYTQVITELSKKEAELSKKK